MSEEKKTSTELDDQSLRKVAGGTDQHIDTKPNIDLSLCFRCGRCAYACPANAISGGDSGYYINPIACYHCTVCRDMCDAGAITIPEGSTLVTVSTRLV